MASRSRIQDSNTLEYFGFCAVRVAKKRFETWEGGGGGLILHQAKRIAVCPYQNFPKCPLRSSLAEANLFAILTVPDVSVIDL